jgi:hypothetical protein
MINKIIFIMFILSLWVMYSCKESHTKANYMPLVTELHQIECEQVKKSGLNFTVNDTNIYTFRGIAFDRIMTKDPNAKLIAHYEDLYQKLAAMEYFMDDEEKSEYRNDVKKEYLIPCK